MRNAPPSPRHQRLIDALAGEWRSDERLAEAPGRPLDQRRSGRLIARSALGGRFVISDYVQELDGQPVFTGHGVYGWDGASYTMQWFDSDADGGGQVVPGVWDGATLRFTRPGHGPRGSYVYEFDAEGYTFTVLVGDEISGWAPVLVATFRRVDMQTT